MKAMRWVLIGIATLSAAGLLLVRGEAVHGAGTDPEVCALRRQVDQLQTRLGTLEERLARVESTKPPSLPRCEVLPRSSNGPAVLLPSQQLLPERSGQSPKIWGQGTINGWPFYFIPCGAK